MKGDRARALSLSLPHSDPRSAVIRTYIERLPAGVDVSADLRRLLVHALETDKTLARIEAKLDILATTGTGAIAPVVQQELEDDSTPALLAALVDFSGI